MDFKLSKVFVLGAGARSDEALFVADSTLRVLEADEAFLDWVGAARDEVEAGRVHLPTDEGGTLCALARDLSALKPGRIWQRRIEPNSCGSRQGAALMTLLPVRNEQGELTQVIGSLRIPDEASASDASELREQSCAAEQLQAQLQREVSKRQQS